jgi:rare lipoprotein A
MTAAHKKLPFGTVVRVTNVATGRSVQVTINDRGPFIPGRIIDLSRGAAVKLGIIDSGVAKVRVEVLG